VKYVSIQQQPHTFDKLILVLQKISLPHLVKEFPAVQGNQGSLPCSQDTTTSPYPELDNTCHCLAVYFIKTHFSTSELFSYTFCYYSASNALALQRSHSLGLSSQNAACISLLHIHTCNLPQINNIDTSTLSLRFVERSFIKDSDLTLFLFILLTLARYTCALISEAASE